MASVDRPGRPGTKSRKPPTTTSASPARASTGVRTSSSRSGRTPAWTPTRRAATSTNEVRQGGGSPPKGSSWVATTAIALVAKTPKRTTPIGDTSDFGVVNALRTRTSQVASANAHSVSSRSAPLTRWRTADPMSSANEQRHARCWPVRTPRASTSRATPMRATSEAAVWGTASGTTSSSRWSRSRIGGVKAETRSSTPARAMVAAAMRRVRRIRRTSITSAPCPRTGAKGTRYRLAAVFRGRNVRLVRETAADLETLQRRLDESMAAAGEHPATIFDAAHRPSGTDVCERLDGILEVDLACVTGEGAPLVAPIDAFLFRGDLWVGVPGPSVRARLLRRDPRVSASYNHDGFALIVHGTLEPPDERGP